MFILNRLVWKKFQPSGRKFLRELREHIRQVRKIGQEQIENRLNALAEGYTSFDDLLNHFLEFKASRDEKFDLDLALDEFITFFIAGYIFITWLLTWISSKMIVIFTIFKDKKQQPTY